MVPATLRAQENVGDTLVLNWDSFQQRVLENDPAILKLTLDSAHFQYWESALAKLDVKGNVDKEKVRIEITRKAIIRTLPSLFNIFF